MKTALAVTMCAMLPVISTVPAENNAPVPTALNFSMKSIEGKDISLADYQGKVILMVNVASKCGYTPQYEELQALHTMYGERGLVILGFPANNFGRQEPGTNDEILEFCRTSYDVEFTMFAKVSVKGDDICDLYKLLTDQEKTPASGGEIKWNFEKFLLDRDGNVVKHYRSKVTPKAIAPEIEDLLAARPAQATPQGAAAR
jgi:glutathione peroxidase